MSIRFRLLKWKLARLDRKTAESGERFRESMAKLAEEDPEAADRLEQEYIQGVGKAYRDSGLAERFGPSFCVRCGRAWSGKEEGYWITTLRPGAVRPMGICPDCQTPEERERKEADVEGAFRETVEKGRRIQEKEREEIGGTLESLDEDTLRKIDELMAPPDEEGR